MLWLIHMIGREKHNQQENLLYVIIKEVVLYHWSLTAELREMHLQNKVKPNKPPFKTEYRGGLLQEWFIGSIQYASHPSTLL